MKKSRPLEAALPCVITIHAIHTAVKGTAKMFTSAASTSLIAMLSGLPRASPTMRTGFSIDPIWDADESLGEAPFSAV